MSATTYQRFTGKNMTLAAGGAGTDAFGDTGIPTGGHVVIEIESDGQPIQDTSCTGDATTGPGYLQAGTDRPPGNWDYRGYMYAWGLPPVAGGEPVIFPDQTFSFAFGLLGNEGGLKDLNAFCTALQIFVPTYDRQQRNGVYYIAHFASAGGIAAQTSQQAAWPLKASGSLGATTNVPILPVKGLGFSFGGYNYWAHQMKLEIRSLARRTVDSAWMGVYGRVPAGIDWSFEGDYNFAATAGSSPPLTIDNTVPGSGSQGIAMPEFMDTQGDLYMQVIYSSTIGINNAWKLTKGILRRYEEKIDHDSHEPVGGRMTIEMANDQSSGSPGEIHMPDGTGSGNIQVF